MTQRERTNFSMSYEQSNFNQLVFETMQQQSEMEFEEAVQFSITQLERQGVVTSMLIRDANVIRGEDPITKFSIKYCDLKEDEPVDVIQLTEDLNSISTLVSGDNKMQVYAAQKNVQNMLIAICKIHPGGQDVLKLTLTCLKNLITGHPELMNKEMMDYLIELDDRSDELLKTIIRTLLLESFKFNEKNKALFFQHPNALTIIKSCINDINSSDYLVGCDIIHSLCSDDDTQNPLSDFHARARFLADQFMLQMYQGLRMPHNSDITGAMLKAVEAMVISFELVAILYKEDPTFLVIHDIIHEFRSHKLILLYAARLMKTLCLIEDGRNGLAGLIPIIVRTMDENIGYLDLQKKLFKVICYVTFRNQKNATAFMELGAVEKIVQGMKTHNHVKLRKNGLMALRSLAFRSNQPKDFLDAGVEEFVKSLMVSDSELIEECNDVLSALRAQRNRSPSLTETPTTSRNENPQAD